MASINFYERYATEHLSINLDDNGLYCEVISECKEGVSYQVAIDEELMQATKCNCLGHRRWGHCKHADIVNKAFAGYNTTPVVTEVEAGAWYIVNHNTQVWMADGQWMAVGPAQDAIEIVKAHLGTEAPETVETSEVEAPVIEIKVPAKKRAKRAAQPAKIAALMDQAVAASAITDVSKKGNLNVGQAYSLMR